MGKVVITGGTGMIGREVKRLLQEQGFDIVVLSRRLKQRKGRTRYAYWCPERREIDIQALSDAEHVINLAGEPIAEKRWTRSQKQEILDSRVRSTSFLIEQIKTTNLPLKSFVSASAVGYYGASTSQGIFSEADGLGRGFLAEVCNAWETALRPLAETDARLAVLRIGLVLSREGGFLGKILPLARKSLNVQFGSGRQILPWIHLSDLARIFVDAVTNPAYSGTFNAVVAPEQQPTQKEFNRQLASHLKRRVWLPNVPAFLLKPMLGEKAQMLLTGSKMSHTKLMETGFQFQIPDLGKAFDDLLG